jgi:hypothetical protein
MLCIIGRRAFDRRNLSRIARAVLAAAVAVAAHRLAAPLGHIRLFIDFLVYAGLAVAFRAVDPRELVGMARILIASRRQQPTPGIFG